MWGGCGLLVCGFCFFKRDREYNVEFSRGDFFVVEVLGKVFWERRYWRWVVRMGRVFLGRELW